MSTTVSAQIWRSPAGIERVWGLGEPIDKNARPLLTSSIGPYSLRHEYVRNEDRVWVDYENLGEVFK